MKAWQDMRFGMFICWGPVTMTNREIGWSRGAPTPIAVYDNLYKKWNPQNFDAKAWVGIAKTRRDWSARMLRAASAMRTVFEFIFPPRT